MAGASETIGLIIDVQQQNVQTLGQISNKLSGIGDSAAKAAKQGFDGFQQFGKAFVFLNQGLEVAKKAFKLFEKTVIDSIGVALDFRSEMDPGKKALTDFGKELQVTQARLGDTFIPLLVGVAKAVGPILVAFQAWLAQNREMISSGIIKFVQVLATALVAGLGGAAKIVTSLWMAMRVSFAKVLGVIGSALAIVDDSFQEFADHQKAEAAMAVRNWTDQQQGIEEVSTAVLDVVDNAGRLASTWKDAKQEGRLSSAERKQALAEEAKQLAELDKIFEDAAKRAAGQLAKDKAALVDATKAYNDALTAAQEMRMSSALELEKKKKDEQKEFADAEKKKRAEFEKNHEKMKEKLVNVSNALMGVFNAARGGFDSLITYLSEKIITFLAQSFILLFLNLLTGGALSFGEVIGGATKQVFGFADGGLVRGGISGRDSVPAMLTPGEFVLPTHVVDSIRSGSAPSRPQQFASGGFVSAGHGSGSNSAGPPVVVNAFTTSRAQLRRLQRDVFEPERGRLVRNRVIKAG